jgi:DNA-binding response OmpR family regulator
MKLLLIEDDREIAEALRGALTHDYDITLAETGRAGLSRAETGSFDAIILDLNLPDISGLAVCQELRLQGLTTPILILSGEAQVLSKIRLLDAGADDYLTKPFSLGELKARLRVLKRHDLRISRDPAVFQVADLTLDTRSMQVMRAGKTIVLRKKEYALLECLMRHAGNIVSRDQLVSFAWRPADTPWTNTIDVHIKHLRDQVDKPFQTKLIQTIHGLGYKIEEPTKPRSKS